MRVGVAGYMGAGKSECARLMGTGGQVVIDADAEAKELMNRDAEIRERLAAAFGDEVISETGVYFGALGRRAFESRRRLERLNEIVHPPLLEHLAALMREDVEHSRILDAALIPYWGIEHWFDRLVWVSCFGEIRKCRLERKTSLDRAAIEQRMALQEKLMPAPRAEPWIRVANEGSLTDLEAALTAAGLIEAKQH
jgi:dephospho-CoA kinase